MADKLLVRYANLMTLVLFTAFILSIVATVYAVQADDSKDHVKSYETTLHITTAVGAGACDTDGDSFGVAEARLNIGTFPLGSRILAYDFRVENNNAAGTAAITAATMDYVLGFGVENVTADTPLIAFTTVGCQPGADVAAQTTSPAYTNAVNLTASNADNLFLHVGSGDAGNGALTANTKIHVRVTVAGPAKLP